MRPALRSPEAGTHHTHAPLSGDARSPYGASERLT